MDESLKKIVNSLANLYGRWMDEREYEDWADYAKLITQWAESAGFTQIQPTKRPFGFKALHGVHKVQVRATTRKVYLLHAA